MQPTPWSEIAFNQATDSENRIHSDEVARQYGFRGGLVPGVTVFAYLVHPALVAWGESWLETGRADVDLKRPLYDGGRFEVALSAEGTAAYLGEIRDAEGTACAKGRVDRNRPLGALPERRGDPPAPARDERRDASRAVLEELREKGCGALEAAWLGEGELDRYTRSLDAMPDCVRPDRGGLAHPGYSLALANWVLAANVRLGPWIHVSSDVQYYAPIPLGSRIVVEARVTDLSERRGHELVDLDVTAFLEGDRPALRAQHSAIYRLREPTPS